MKAYWLAARYRRDAPTISTFVVLADDMNDAIEKGSRFIADSYIKNDCRDFYFELEPLGEGEA